MTARKVGKWRNVPAGEDRRRWPTQLVVFPVCSLIRLGCGGMMRTLVFDANTKVGAGRRKSLSVGRLRRSCSPVIAGAPLPRPTPLPSRPSCDAGRARRATRSARRRARGGLRPRPVASRPTVPARPSLGEFSSLQICELWYWRIFLLQNCEIVIDLG